jgi:hypothetical protein
MRFGLNNVLDGLRTAFAAVLPYIVLTPRPFLVGTVMAARCQPNHLVLFKVAHYGTLPFWLRCNSDCLIDIIGPDTDTASITGQIPRVISTQSSESSESSFAVCLRCTCSRPVPVSKRIACTLNLGGFLGSASAVPLRHLDVRMGRRVPDML